MKTSLVFAAAIVAAGLIVAAAPAHAGRSCETEPPRVVSVQQAMTLAERTAKRLDATGAEAVVIARIGQDLSRYNLRFSHIGLAYKDAGRWRVVHKLNQCGSARADVYRQGLGEFFLDDMFRYEAGFVVLAPPVQRRVVELLRDDRRAVRLHEAHYSMLAYPWSQKYQQSNQWALETLAMAEEPAATTRERAQSWLKLRGYEPTTLRLGPLTRLGARVTAANVAFDDHPNEKRFSDRIETISADSVFDWLAASGLGAPAEVIR